MSIRRATPDDADAIARVHVDSWRSAYRGLVPDSHLERLNYEIRAKGFRESIASGAEETYLVEQAGDLIGFLTLGGCRDADLDAALTGEIWGIYLAPQYWRRGVGRQLCHEAEKMLISRNYRQAVLWVFEGNASARRFYEAMGFEVDGASKTLNPGAPLQAIRYRKRLEVDKQTIASSQILLRGAPEGRLRGTIMRHFGKWIVIFLCSLLLCLIIGVAAFDFLAVQPVLSKIEAYIADAAPSERNPTKVVVEMLRRAYGSRLKYIVTNSVLREEPSLVEGMSHLQRQFTELGVGFLLRMHLSEPEIATAFLSTAYMGSGVIGFAQASIRYFGMPLEDLSIRQAAQLIAIADAPAAHLLDQQRLEHRMQDLLSAEPR